MNTMEMQKVIDRAIKNVWNSNIPRDYQSFYLLKEDSLKNALYYHLRTKLHDFLETNNIRIFTEFHY
ncbi:hypothetical protein RZN22_19220, partial [Bacillaceae bacterium S4-13-58]